MALRLQLVFLVIFLSFYSLSVFAINEDQDLDQIEAEIKKTELKRETNVNEKDTQEIKVDTYSDLSKLQPFSEVAVLQKRFLPKTGRVQFFGGLGLGMNDPWNNSIETNLRLAYGFTESMGLELAAYFMNTSASQAAQDLQAQHGVSANIFAKTASYNGAQFMWTPIYGKFSLEEKRIIPFDMYFSFGGGTSVVEGSSLGSASTISVSTGQIFALSRAAAFRWDLTLNSYSLPNGAISNLMLTFGGSYYIPEAPYR